jgi:quinoprotein dehydrogenase-associated probable ABC transporter substrate-binding protein
MAAAALATLAVVCATHAAAETTRALRVCSDPNNLPFSNERGEGFENAVARLVARELHRPLTYFWLPQRRGFIRNTLGAHNCDVVVGVPAGYALVRTTQPYYASTYVFVSRRDRGARVKSFDDPRLKQLRIGIQVTGDDYANPPAAQALAARHIVSNVRGFTVYGDYSRPNPPRGVVDAVADRSIDVAVAWGPLAGYFARREPVPLDVVPVSPSSDGPFVRFVFAIAMGVRRDDVDLARALDGVVVRRRAAIHRILTRYGVPLVADEAGKAAGRAGK